VDENEDIQHTVLTVTAKDHDECEYWALLLRCSLWGGLLGPSQENLEFPCTFGAFCVRRWLAVRKTSFHVYNEEMFV
jgi:hypothetical protein